MSRLSARRRAVVSILLGLASALALCELYVRVRPPKPPSQVVRDHGLRMLRDVPVWDWWTTDTLRHVTCTEQHPDRLRIMVVGDSVAGGTGIDAHDVFTNELEDRLNAAHPSPGFCVMNFSVPGFHFDQKLATLQDALPKYHPDLVLWQVGSSEPLPYGLLGDGAFALDGWPLRKDGFPGVPGVPDVLNRWLFVHSHLYQYLDIDMAEAARLRSVQPPIEHEFLAKRFPLLPALVHSTHTRVVLYLSCPLDRPFREILPDAPGFESIEDVSWQRPIADAARAAGIPAYYLQEELKDQDYVALRFDPCCHFNVAGQHVLAQVFERVVPHELDRPRP